jgi:hypothetical protein
VSRDHLRDNARCIPGARTVTAEPYKGIDTEGSFYP